MNRFATTSSEWFAVHVAVITNETLHGNSGVELGHH